MVKNSIYLSNAEIFKAEIYSSTGSILYTKNFDDHQNAISWCEGMARSSKRLTYKLFDNQTNVELASGPEMSEEEMGIKTELEHRDLVIKMLIDAGQEPTEEKIKSILKEIVRVHLEEDPQYYEKIEKVVK